tara:strand:- start:6 stop:191 length:186 start_codon:yes stop_codon:yes gene_type:complete
MIETYKIIYHENDDDMIELATDLRIINGENGIVNEVQEKLDELKKTYSETYLMLEKIYPHE